MKYDLVNISSDSSDLTCLLLVTGFVSPRRLSSSTVCDQETRLAPTVPAAGVPLAKDIGFEFQSEPVAAAGVGIASLKNRKVTSEWSLQTHVEESLITVDRQLRHSFDLVSEESEIVPTSEHWDDLKTLLRNTRTSDVLAADDSNPYSVLESCDGGCTFRSSLRGKAVTLVRWFKSFGLKPIRGLPAEVRCGELRKAVRQCFPEVSPLWELSFKTVQKLEKRVCDNCSPLEDLLLNQWKEARMAPVSVSEDHVRLFEDALRRNVPQNWDDSRRVFIPNGNATREHGRACGGNWNVEELSNECRVELVWSSGKPRVVTMYSQRNTSLLYPLHQSLYSKLRRKGWLLVGPPTDKKVAKLNGADYLSFDYSSATDNIKTAYVKAAVRVLKEKAECLSDEECSALDVLAGLNFGSGEVNRGQPMGSVMSFPLLCLINKAVVDLSLDRLLASGRITFPEWSQHRCLINGDDLLCREPRRGLGFRSILAEEGSHVGLVVNLEKSMEDPCLAEVNSTLFENSVEQKKFNASAVWMDSSVNDVLGFAFQASHNLRTFQRIVRSNLRVLATQEHKGLWALPAVYQSVCRRDRRIRRAIVAGPAELRPREEGVIRMAAKPEGYDLDRNQENDSIQQEVDRVRGFALSREKPAKFRTRPIDNAHSYSSCLRRPAVRDEELTLECLVKTYRRKQWQSVENSEVVAPPDYEFPPSDDSRVNACVDFIRSRKRETSRSNPGTDSSDFVSLVC